MSRVSGDEAIQSRKLSTAALDCFASLAMTKLSIANLKNGRGLADFSNSLYVSQGVDGPDKPGHDDYRGMGK